jgi:hypothetical protein
MEIYRGGFSYNYFYDFCSRSHVARYPFRVLVKDVIWKATKEKRMKETYSMDWKYVFLSSLVLISALMTLIGLILESF